LGSAKQALNNAAGLILKNCISESLELIHFVLGVSSRLNLKKTNPK